MVVATLPASPSRNLSNAISNWQCNVALFQSYNNNNSAIPVLGDVQMLLKDIARNGTSKRNASIDYNDWKGEVCDKVGKSLPPRPDQPVLVHVFYPFGDIIDERKKHLMLLSFLATQCSENSKLVVWHKQKHAPKMLPMPRHLYSRIQVRRFTLQDIQDMGFSRNTTKRLVKEYKGSHQAGTTDIARVTILYNHGGIWVDSDVLLLRNLSPISGLNFVYQAQKNVLNGAVMGAATPRSNFIFSMVQYIDSRLVQHTTNDAYFKWAHVMFNKILKGGGEMPFLPGCLFDGAWFRNKQVPHPAPVHWDHFFGQKAHEGHVRYIDPQIAQFHGPLAYHWHGRWTVPIVEGSLADRADVLYREALSIPLHNSSSRKPQESSMATLV